MNCHVHRATRVVILSPSDKIRCWDSGGVYRRQTKDLNVWIQTKLALDDHYTQID
jgi:hypothetical protein